MPAVHQMDLFKPAAERQFLQDLAMHTELPLPLTEVLWKRGYRTVEAIQKLLVPSLDQLVSPLAYPQMPLAVKRLRDAIEAEKPIAIYADRDVDGLSGLAILVRTLRTLGGTVHYGSPVQGRGIEQAILNRLVKERGCGLLIFVDCGSGDTADWAWLIQQGVNVIVADHHRSPEAALSQESVAWIHPAQRMDQSLDVPAGCVMAFTLARALWQSFLGNDDPARLDYFVYDHLDLVALGILADRMPLIGENRTLVALGLKRLANSRKEGLSALTRFFRLTPRATALTVREASWQIIPILNAGGRLGRPDLTAELLLSQDSYQVRKCIDELLTLNKERRMEQDRSLAHFEKAVLEQCNIDEDPILVAMATGLHPSVSGLAAQALVRKYERPIFLFVDQGETAVGSARSVEGVDIYAWVERHRMDLVKFGGHGGALGVTLNTADFSLFREKLIKTARECSGTVPEPVAEPEADIHIKELVPEWYRHLERLGPFGEGHSMPIFRIRGVDHIQVQKRPRGRTKQFSMCGSGSMIPVEMPLPLCQQEEWLEGPYALIALPIEDKKGPLPFRWAVQKVIPGFTS